MKHFADNLKSLRVHDELKQKELAEKFGVGLRTFQQWEHGDREPNIDTLIALSDYFNVSLDELVGRKVGK